MCFGIKLLCMCSCGSGAAGTDLVNGTLTKANIVDGSPVTFTVLGKL